MPEQVRNRTQDVSSIPGPAQCVEDLALLQAVAEAGSCSSASTPSLGTSTCCRCSPKKERGKKKKKRKEKKPLLPSVRAAECGTESRGLYPGSPISGSSDGRINSRPSLLPVKAQTGPRLTLSPASVPGPRGPQRHFHDRRTPGPCRARGGGSRPTEREAGSPGCRGRC